MRFLKNLSSYIAESGFPWEFRNTAGIPPKVRADKKERAKWITNPSTSHCVYSLIEGLNASARITSSRGQSEGNPAFLCHGFAADFDVPVSENFIAEGLERSPFLPNYMEKTLSGNVRLLWLIDSPVRFVSHTFAVVFLKYVSTALQLEKIVPGFDRAAFEDPARYYTNSGEWFQVSDKKLSADLATGWQVKVSEQIVWSGREFGECLDLAKVAPLLAKRYPRFAEWPGDFALGAQGPTFWVEDSVSPKSAIVRETGIQTFASHASKPFYSWSELIGESEVAAKKAQEIGQVVNGIHYDGKSYYRVIPEGLWVPSSKDDLIGHLKVTCGVSAKVDKSRVSDVDRAVQYIQDYQRVTGAAPFAFQPAGIIMVNRRKFLNIHTRRVVSPADEKAVWGPAGGMPTLSKFFDGFFDPIIQLDYFLSWASYAYRSFYLLSPRSGHSVIISGPPNIGKSFLNTGIMPALFGGMEDARAYLMGEDDFGAELFDVGYWPIDDSTAAHDHISHKKFSEMTKRMVANRTFRYHAKFQQATSVVWQGRICITCNRDEESLRIIPELEMSNREKLMLFRTASTPPIDFLDQTQMEHVIEREIAVFARYLLDFELPEHCRGDVRFGVQHYHEPSLVESAEQSSYYSAFYQILHDWRENFFVVYPKQEYWEGTALQLQKSILMLCPEIQLAMRPYSVDAIARALAVLKNRGSAIECFSKEGIRIWRIKK